MGGPGSLGSTGAAGEIPLLLSFPHLPGEAGRPAPGGLALLVSSRGGPSPEGSPPRRPVPGTVAGGEFDWGGTPVKL